MSSSTVQVYLFLGGRCEEAIEFYGKALGAQVEMLMRHKDSPEPPPPGTIPQGWENKVMHASFRIGQTTVMASDGCGESTGIEGFSPWRSMSRQPRKPTRPSPRCPREVKSPCRSAKPSGLPSSACWRTASASAGW